MSAPVPTLDRGLIGRWCSWPAGHPRAPRNHPPNPPQPDGDDSRIFPGANWPVSLPVTLLDDSPEGLVRRTGRSSWDSLLTGPSLPSARRVGWSAGHGPGRCASGRGECGQHLAKIIRANGLAYERQIEEGKRKAALVRRANRMDIATLTIALLAVTAFLARIPAGARRGRASVGVGALVTHLLAIGPFPQTSPAPTATGPQPTTRARQGRAGGGFAADWCNGNTLGSFPGAGGSTPSSAIRARRDGAGTGNTPDLGRDANDKGELTWAGVYWSSPRTDGSVGGVCGAALTKTSADYSQPWLPGGHRGARPAPPAPILPFVMGLGALP